MSQDFTLFFMSKKKKKAPRLLPPEKQSLRLLITLAPEKVNLFRFLLESYENLAFFTVLNRKTALLKVVFSSHQEEEVRKVLADMATCVPLEMTEFPVPQSAPDQDQ